MLLCLLYHSILSTFYSFLLLNLTLIPVFSLYVIPLLLWDLYILLYDNTLPQHFVSGVHSGAREIVRDTIPFVQVNSFLCVI